MAIPQPAIGVTVRPRRPSMAWAWWILLSVCGAVVAAFVSWEIRSFVVSQNWPAGQDEASRYVATIVAAVIASAAQWWVLRRYQVDAYWWVPATVGAGLLADLLVIPPVLRLFLPPAGAPVPSLLTVMLVGGIALAGSGVILGAVQAWILRRRAANAAWLWVPATTVGGALAGAVTTALSPQILGMAPIVAVALAAAAGSLLIAGCQAPVLLRILR